MQPPQSKAPGPQWGQTQGANHCTTTDAPCLDLVLMFRHSNQGKKADVKELKSLAAIVCQF